MGLYEDSFLSLDTEELESKDKELFNKLISKGSFEDEDYSVLDGITDIYMARRVIVLLLKDIEDYKEIAEQSILNLKELTKLALLLGGDKVE